jgi:hypothetical protein
MSGLILILTVVYVLVPKYSLFRAPITQYDIIAGRMGDARLECGKRITRGAARRAVSRLEFHGHYVGGCAGSTSNTGWLKDTQVPTMKQYTYAPLVRLLLYI